MCPTMSLEQATTSIILGIVQVREPDGEVQDGAGFRGDASDDPYSSLVTQSTKEWQGKQ
jgi:hypothetical protein